MEYCHERAGHQRDHFEKAVHVLLDRRHVTVLNRVADVPQRGRFMREEAGDHDREHQRIDLEEQAHQ